MAVKGLYIEAQLIKSKAFEKLNAIAIKVYLMFLMRRQMEKVKRKRGKTGGWIIKNNGKIVFTYNEAEKKGITRPRFSRALDSLVEYGFIDITHSGCGSVKGDTSKYAISERWKKYGTDSFIEKEREKDSRQGRGWTAYHTKKNELKTSQSEATLIEFKKLKQRRKNRQSSPHEENKRSKLVLKRRNR